MIFEIQVDEDVVSTLTGYQTQLYRERGYNATIEQIIEQSILILAQDLELREPEQFPIIVGENLRANYNKGLADGKTLANALEPDS